jgi:hypothetical protein
MRWWCWDLQEHSPNDDSLEDLRPVVFYRRSGFLSGANQIARIRNSPELNHLGYPIPLQDLPPTAHHCADLHRHRERVCVALRRMTCVFAPRAHVVSLLELGFVDVEAEVGVQG